MFPINLIGKDATEAFEDVGHSDEARGLLEGMFVGEFEKDGVSCPSLSKLPMSHSCFANPNIQPLKAKIYHGVGGTQANTAPPQSVSKCV